MIAVVVLSIGVLGLAALQFASLRGNNQSYERSQALAFANEIADQMRANRAAAGSGSFAVTAGNNPPAGGDCVAATCTAAQIAAFELGQWHTRLRNTLPGGTASIQCSVNPCTVGAMQTVSVFWDENRSGTADSSVQVSFAP